MLRSALAGILISATGFAESAPDFFRLEPGSVREYRAQTSTDSFTIRVGTMGIMHNEHVHYAVTGYGKDTLLIHRDDRTGALYYLNQDTEQDTLLTSIEQGPGWFQANQRPCDQEGHAEGLVPYLGPSGEFANALAIRYRSYGCADTGIESERYVENLGMVQRTFQTFAGPVHYDLVHASIGPMLVTEQPGTTFSVGVRRTSLPRVIVDLRWNAPAQGAELEMPTSQEYEVVLRNAKGDILWRWSDGQFFLQQPRTRTVRHLSYDVEVPLQFYGILLNKGVYTVEAWLTTVQERRYAGSVSFLYTPPTVPGAGQE